MRAVVLERDGQKSLRFIGRVIGESSSEWIEGQAQSRWSRLTLYELDINTKGAKYALHREFLTRWQGEGGTSTVQLYRSTEDLLNAINATGDMDKLTADLFREAAEYNEDFAGAWIEDIAIENMPAEGEETAPGPAPCEIKEGIMGEGAE